MNFEVLIFGSAISCIESLVFYFGIILVLDMLRTFLFPTK